MTVRILEIAGKHSHRNACTPEINPVINVICKPRLGGQFLKFLGYIAHRALDEPFPNKSNVVAAKIYSPLRLDQSLSRRARI